MEFDFTSQSGKVFHAKSDGMRVFISGDGLTDAITLYMTKLIGTPKTGFNIVLNDGKMIALADGELSKFHELKDIYTKSTTINPGVTFLKWAAIIIGGLFILILMIGIFASNDDTKTTANNDETQSSTKNKAPEVANTQADLPFTVDEFKSQFNSAAREFKSDNTISNIEINDGQVNNSATITLDNNSSLVLAINKKTNKVVGITLIGVPDQKDPQGGLKVIVEMGVLIAASNPQLTPEERGGIFKSLGLMEKNLDLSDYKKTYIKDNIKYFIVTSKATGIMFGVESATTAN